MISKIYFLFFVLLVSGFVSSARAATFTVTLGGDAVNDVCDQFCSLREAINAANQNGSGADIINFDLNPAVTVIQPSSALPIIRTSLTINGTTQTGYFGAPVIVLDGSGAGENVNGLRIESPAIAATLNVSILGLAINRFSGHGIYSNCTNACNVTIQGNRIGTNSGGSIDVGNGVDGINIIETGGSNYVIGGSGTFEGNVISGNERNGITIQPFSWNAPTGTGTLTIEGNLIGVNAAGTAALGNSGDGIKATNVAYGTNNIYELSLKIGGTTPAQRNVISGNGGDGIVYDAHDVSILGNYIGTNQAGTAALPNKNGINAGNSSHAVIGGFSSTSRNVVSGNAVSGISLNGTAGIYRNYIGTSADGNADLGNGGNGISLENGSVAAIGGTITLFNVQNDLGNVISGNGASGIIVLNTASTEPHQIKRNRIGTNAAGTAEIANAQFGIYLGNGAPSPSAVPHVIGSDANAADGNLISGNKADGIRIDGSSGHIKVFGNKIGTNFDATDGIPNGSSGLHISSESNEIGAAGNDIAANIISQNKIHGILFSGATANYNKIHNNFIGTNASGAQLGNYTEGIAIYGGNSNQIGSGTAAGGNRIAFNNFRAVNVVAGTGNSIRRNSIYSNGAGVAIDLGDDGVTQNDQGDADAGANNLQNFPVIVNASPTQLAGTLNSQPNKPFVIDFYQVGSCDVSGNGEGRYFIASKNVTVVNGGTSYFNFQDIPLALGQIITATATDENGNTSEFSQCYTVNPSPGTLSFSDSVYVAGEAAGTRLITVNRTNGSYGTIQVNYATSDQTATAGQDYNAASGTLVFNDGEISKSFNVSINDDAIDETDETLKLTLSFPTNGSHLVNPATAILTIQDNVGTQLSIGGAVSYGITPANQSEKIVSGVLMSAAAGDSSVSVATDSSGVYSLDNLTAGGQYLVTPSKTGNINGITPFDATLVLRHVAAGGMGANALNANQQQAADTNNSGTVSPFDATQILRFVAANAQTPNTGQVGNWRFSPVARNYNSLNNSLAGENYEAILIGEVNGNWTPPADSFVAPENSAVDEAEIQNHSNAISEFESAEPAANSATEDLSSIIDSVLPDAEISLQNDVSAAGQDTILIPVMFANHNSKAVSAYSFDVAFDSDLLEPDTAEPVETNATLSLEFTVVQNTAQRGRIGIAAARSDASRSLAANGILLYLRFKVIATTKSTISKASSLAFTATPVFEDENGSQFRVKKERLGAASALARQALDILTPTFKTAY
jgi:CSLREA domain-containing protein